jgi:hypothetical protein
VDFAVGATLDVIDVDKVLNVDSGIHATGARRVGDMVALLLPEFVRRFRRARRLHRAQILGVGHVASKAALGVHSALFSEVTPSAVQFHAR